MSLRLLPLLLILLIAACTGQGAAGVAAPPADFLDRVEAGSGPHSVLAGPAGTQPAPAIVTPVYPVPAARLFAAVNRVAAGWERTFPMAARTDPLEAAYVVRSQTMNFPDVVVLRVRPAGAGASTLLLHSESQYGYYDFKVNQERVVAWLAALERESKNE